MVGFTRNLTISSVALSFNATTTVPSVDTTAALDMITNDRLKKNQEALLQWSADIAIYWYAARTHPATAAAVGSLSLSS
jgi:hypothetical protein